MKTGDQAVYKQMVVKLERVGTFTAQFRHPVTGRMTTVKVQSLVSLDEYLISNKVI